MGLWGYNVKLIPIIPPYIPWDFTLMPVTAMLFYQYKPRTNPIVKAAIFSGLGSFIFQPIFEWLGFYNPQNWMDWYSFPIMAGIYLIGHLCTKVKSFREL
jgi:hypothetical protein